MDKRRANRFFGDWSSFLLLLAASVVTTPTAEAFTPDDPVVRKMIRDGVDFLGRTDHTFRGEYKLGADCLIALAILKADNDPTHPRIANAVEVCQAEVPKYSEASGNELYGPAIALYFLCELNESKGEKGKHDKEIQALLKYILSRQQGAGGWGYQRDDKSNLGDTSQTQYCVLSLWAANRSKYDVPAEAMARALNWLIRTQDPKGHWGYKGADPRNGARTKQTPVSQSMSAAGLSSVYVAADALGFRRLTGRNDDIDPRLPPDVQYFVEEEDVERKAKRPRDDLVNAPALAQCQRDGNSWFKEHYSIKNTEEEWQYYYMYALERYQAFKAHAEEDHVPEPKWYNDGVRFLKEEQAEHGGWAPPKGQAPVNTAFAVLFLTRGTTIDSPVDLAGLLKGMGQLPVAGKIIERNGRLYGETISLDVEQLIVLIETQGANALPPTSFVEMKFSEKASERPAQWAKLRALVSHEAPEVRILAVRVLGKERSFDSVPFLIYALSDPDARVINEASIALRYVSRKLDGMGLVDKPTDAQRREAQRKWKQWFVSVQPDAVFFN